MNTSEKGNKLEDNLFDYLCDQKKRGCLIYGTYSPDLSKIFKKKEYYCAERQSLVEFDVVIELYRQGSREPNLYVVFECKNHNGSIAERDVTDFSDKLTRIFRHAAKGVIVSASRLQSGAENIARSRKLGIAKFIRDGLEVTAERQGHTSVEIEFIKTQMFTSKRHIKSLKFSAYYNGSFFCSPDQFLVSLGSQEVQRSGQWKPKPILAVPFLSEEKIRQSSKHLLAKVECREGAVNLSEICSHLAVELEFTGNLIFNDDGVNVLGSANFDRRLIQINLHENKQRERFTISHEIGHFYLLHDYYLRSESIVEQDFFSDRDKNDNFNYDRLEYQANIFAADLLLPDEVFLSKVREHRELLEIVNRGHGYKFVDDQPCNYRPYNHLITCLQFDFDVSAQVIEIKLKRKGLLRDQRVKFKSI